MSKQNLKLKIFFLGILFFSIFGLAKNASAGTAFYFDGSDTGSQNLGTYAEPFNTMAKVNQHPFATGDDLYFKSGTTYLVPAGQYLDVDWNGTSGDWVIIGSYHGDGQFGLNGGARPILAANNYNFFQDIGIIQKTGVYPTRTDAYTEVKDIRVNNPYQFGIIGADLNFYKITNCYIYQGLHAGAITVVRSQEVTIDGNIIDRAAMAGPSSGGCLQVGQSSMKNVIVSNNTISGMCTEGITIYHQGENYEVFGNTVFDTYNVGIYVDRAKYVNIYDNIVYTSTTSPGGRKMWVGIGVDNEIQAGFCFTGNVNINNNKVANTAMGVMIASENTSCINQYINAYDNILADNTSNFGFWGGHSSWHDNNIYNNISYNSNNSTMYHADGYSAPGIIWGANIFDDAVTGNAGIEACTVVSPLAKTSGWNNLTAGAVTVSDFALSSAGITGRTACFGGGGDTTAPSAPSGLSVE